MRLSLLLALLVASGFTHAREPVQAPQRMPGLWMMNTTVTGIPDVVRNYHICVAQDADDSLAHPNIPVTSCGEQTWQRDRHFTYLDATCVLESGAVTLTGKFGGDFQYNFQGELTLTYDPPVDGVDVVTVSYEGRRLAPCKDHLERGVFLIQGENGIGNLNLSQ